MEPRFISCNVAVMHRIDFSFPDAWSRKKSKPGVFADVWNSMYTPADDL